VGRGSPGGSEARWRRTWASIANSPMRRAHRFRRSCEASEVRFLDPLAVNLDQNKMLPTDGSIRKLPFGSTDIGRGGMMWELSSRRQTLPRADLNDGSRMLHDWRRGENIGFLAGGFVPTRKAQPRTFAERIGRVRCGSRKSAKLASLRQQLVCR
jgi:hypothetical protein